MNMPRGKKAVLLGSSASLLAAACWAMVMGSEIAIVWALAGIVAGLVALALFIQGAKTMAPPEE